MPQNIQEERIRWVQMVERDNIKLKDVIKLFPHSGRTLKRWLKEYRDKGEIGLIPKSTKPKSNPKESTIELKDNEGVKRRDSHSKLLQNSLDFEAQLDFFLNTQGFHFYNFLKLKQCTFQINIKYHYGKNNNK